MDKHQASAFENVLQRADGPIRADHFWSIGMLRFGLTVNL